MRFLLFSQNASIRPCHILSPSNNTNILNLNQELSQSPSTAIVKFLTIKAYPFPLDRPNKKGTHKVDALFVDSVCQLVSMY